MDKAYAKIEGSPLINSRGTFLPVYIPVQIPQDPKGHPQGHSLHKPQNLPDLIVGHAAYKVHGPCKKAHCL